jgi:hypothetical protein
MVDITTDTRDPRINSPNPNGQNEAYLVLPQLPEEYRERGWVRPLRLSYVHVGKQPQYPLRDLTPYEEEVHRGDGYVKYEKYPESRSPLSGRYWTAAQLKSGCQTETKMSLPIAETYARDPKFYGSTFCCGCQAHFPVGEFQWYEDGLTVGS